MMDFNGSNIKEYNNMFKQARLSGEDIQDRVLSLLQEPIFKAVTVCFSDIEGRFHMLDYDKDFISKSHDNLTFDGSSIRGFSRQHESDLKLELDWGATYLLPASFFGHGKLFIFGEIRDKDGTIYPSDIRSKLSAKLKQLKRENGYRVNVAAEIEGFLFKGIDVEQNYHMTNQFEYLTTGGYFNTLPQSPLRNFIDAVAEVQRSMGFENEKDHPEVAPSQFEINWSYTEALIAADQIQLYKMICRQVAARTGLTACFLPKPISGVNGSGMHTNISISNEHGKNLFYESSGSFGLSPLANQFINGVLTNGENICLALNPSVNAYRRLDPAYEAPNEIKVSRVDRGSMIRIPLGNEKSARIEVRTVAPDVNPYLAILSILEAGMYFGPTNVTPRKLPTNIYEAIDFFRDSDMMKQSLGEDVVNKYVQWKLASADRCPKKLGTIVKPAEVMFHHEVTNQQLWNIF